MGAANQSRSHQLKYQSRLRDCQICNSLTLEDLAKMTDARAEELNLKHYDSMSDYQIDCSEQNLI